MSGEGVKDWERVACRGTSPLAGTRGVREVSAAGDSDGIRKADGGFMLPVELSSLYDTDPLPSHHPSHVTVIQTYLIGKCECCATEREAAREINRTRLLRFVRVFALFLWLS
jgi:hypothetical protein